MKVEGIRNSYRDLIVVSVYELQTQLELFLQLNYINKIDNLLNLSIEIEKMINVSITKKGGRK
jgi:four helix bundle protein